jgi:hypothetical protein
MEDYVFGIYLGAQSLPAEDYSIIGITRSVDPGSATEPAC